MSSRMLLCSVLLLGFASISSAADVKDLPIEVQPKDAKAAKVVLIAGSNFFKPGEHEYVAGCGVLMDLLKQTPNVAPVLAIDWPKNPETFAGAKAVVFFLDGGDKHAVLKGDRLREIQKLVDAGVGFVFLHQGVDIAKDLGDRMRGWAGSAWERGHSQRGHWIAAFDKFPEHAVTRGVTPFKIDDGWLFKLRFVPGMKGVTPLLRTANPKAAAKQTPDEMIVSWLYERPEGGRSFTFTGCHLHESFNLEGYRRLLVNGVLWTAHIDVPTNGAPVHLEAADLKKYLSPPKK